MEKQITYENNKRKNSFVKGIFDNANEPKQFAIISGIGHDYRHNDDKVKVVNEKILGLMDLAKSEA